MRNNLALKVAGIIFFLVSMLHLLRLAFQWEVIIGGFSVPFGWSIFGLVFALLLSFWMFKARQ